MKSRARKSPFVSLFIIFSFLFSACSSGPRRITLSGSPTTENERPLSLEVASKNRIQWAVRPLNEIAPGFEIQIAEAVDPKINGTFRVSPEGELLLPYDRKVKGAGLTTTQLENEIRDSYRELLRDLSMKISIKSRDVYVDVRGLVKKPGWYVVKSESSLDELIANSDGLITSSDKNTPQAEYVRIEQLGISNVLKLRDYFSGRRDLVPSWQGGENVFFQSEQGDSKTVGRNYVQILGEVRSPAEYPYQDNADAMYYVVKAGGPTATADMENLNLIQTTPTGRQMVVFSFEDSAKVTDIKPGDTLIVRADVPTTTEKKSRIVSAFASVLQVFATIGLIFVAD